VLTPAEMVGALRLQAHPEGGWYRETWRSETALPNGRAAATSILFLLEADQRSHWHRVDAEELWIYQSGSPLALSVAGSGASRTVTLGADPHAGHTPQHLVPAGVWQSAEGPDANWTLIACVVSPGFEFAGFELAPAGWVPALTAPR